MQPYVLIQAGGTSMADEWVRGAIEAQMSGDLGLSHNRYLQALSLEPRHAVATQNLACLLAQGGKVAESLLAIERALIIDPNNHIMMANHCLLLLEAGQLTQAVAMGREALKLAPLNADGNPARLSLAVALNADAKVNESAAMYQQAIDFQPDHVGAATSLCFVKSLLDVTPDVLLESRQRWHAKHGFKGEKQPHTNSRDPERPLRVGYVSGDFKHHSASSVFGPVVTGHSSEFEAYFYSTMYVDPAKDAKAENFRKYANKRWRDIDKLSDERADELIRADKIDILVDLSGHTNGHRLALFTRKPAPVQVTAWGYVTGTGCPEIDYFFADPVVVPPEERKWFAEKVIDLPCVMTLEDMSEYHLKGDTMAPKRRNGYVTFGAFWRHEKMGGECLRAYAEILKRVPTSKMLFKDEAFAKPDCQRRVLSFMEGIAPDRVMFGLVSTSPEHLLAIQQVDLCLDCWPHGAGVVAMEALYMGVPVLTRYGRNICGRLASTALTAMGRKEWVTRCSWGDFVDTAIAMACNPSSLALPRKTLRRELLDSPVCRDYVRAVEARYRECWRTWCRGG